jgi:putative flippase GtrA
VSSPSDDTPFGEELFVIETSTISQKQTSEIHPPVQSLHSEQDGVFHRVSGWTYLFRQMPRFGLVGGLNTVLDLLVLNGLFLLFPTSSTLLVLAYNVFASSVGAVNSFLLNKYWTFGRRQCTTWSELVRFAFTTLFGIGWSNTLIWLASNVAHPFVTNTVIWTNASKVVAIGSMALISYLGMRLWVFASTPREEGHLHTEMLQVNEDAVDDQRSSLSVQMSERSAEPSHVNEQRGMPVSNHSLSVVLPAYNEEQVIATTVYAVLDTLSAWKMDFEVIVVNDGSTDRTGFVVAAIASAASQVRLVTHPVNRGYGAALVSGFAAATKNLTFFMDADGQFTIDDLRAFFTYIDTYDAVIGYRVARQDTWIRKLNAWGWNRLVSLVLGISVRDMDCAFKLLHTEFLRQYSLETRGAMINAELLYKLTRAGSIYKEVGVRHLPRRAGRATGANLKVIMRAFRELFAYARKWRREEQERMQVQMGNAHRGPPV